MICLQFLLTLHLDSLGRGIMVGFEEIYPLEAKIYLTPNLNCSTILQNNHYYQREKSSRSWETVAFGAWLTWWKQIWKYFELNIPFCLPFSYWKIKTWNDYETQAKLFIFVKYCFKYLLIETFSLSLHFISTSFLEGLCVLLMLKYTHSTDSH